MHVGKTAKVLFRIGYYKNRVLTQKGVEFGVTKNLWGAGKTVGIWGGGVNLIEKISNKFTIPENPYWTSMKARLEVLRPYVDKVDSKIIDELQKPHDVYGNWQTLELEKEDGTTYSARVFRVRVKNNVVLGPAKGGIRYCTGSELMNEKTGILVKTLEQLSKLGAAQEEVEAFVAQWVGEEAQALSLGMTLKNSGAGLDLGGGKGDVFIGQVVQENGKWVLRDLENWRAPRNLAKIARSHSQDLARAGKIGVDIDIPAPDVNTTGQILAWYEEAYLEYLMKETNEIKEQAPKLYEILKGILEEKHDITEVPLLAATTKYSREGNPVPWLGVYTGKPVDLGGSLGRAEATGFGGMDVMRAILDVEGKTISIQGFGNVGAHAAYDLAREGAIVQYINDHTMTLYKEEGFSVKELKEMLEWVNTRPAGEFLINYYQQGKVKAKPLGEFDAADWKVGLDEKTRAILGAKVDILVPAALENQIRKDNVDIIQAPTIVELANGPTTSQAEAILYEREKIVIHDTLANAGGVVVSSFETEQAVLGRWYTREEVNSRRREVLEKAAAATLETMVNRKIETYRIAGDANAVLRIAQKKQERALGSENWVERRDAAEETGKKKE